MLVLLIRFRESYLLAALFIGTFFGGMTLALDWQRSWLHYPIPIAVGAHGAYILTSIVQETIL